MLSALFGMSETDHLNDRSAKKHRLMATDKTGIHLATMMNHATDTIMERGVKNHHAETLTYATSADIGMKDLTARTIPRRNSDPAPTKNLPNKILSYVNIEKIKALAAGFPNQQLCIYIYSMVYNMVSK